MFLVRNGYYTVGQGGGEKNGVDDRGSVHPSGDQIKVVTKTRSKQQEKNQLGSR